jgi:hypothetical protein
MRIDIALRGDVFIFPEIDTSPFYYAALADNDCAPLPAQAVSEHPENNDEIGQQRSKSTPWSRRITPRLFRVN